MAARLAASRRQALIETIREFQKKKNKKPQPEPTPEELVAAETRAAESAAGDIITSIMLFLPVAGTEATPPIYKCSPAKREELLDWTVKLNKALRELKKKSKKAK